MRKNISFWLYFCVAIILAIYFTSRIISSYLGYGPISTVRTMHIVNDSKDYDLLQIKTSAGIAEGTTIKSLDLSQINHRILQIPTIKNVSTRLLPNGDLYIKTQNHKIIALWTDGEMFYPLSTDGTKINTPYPEAEENTIVFEGDIPKNPSKATSIFMPLLKHINHVKLIDSRRWNIYTKNNIVIYLPEENPDIAINKIKVLNNTHQILSRKIEIIDLRDPTRILIKEKL